jgi:hypothetical protein
MPGDRLFVDAQPVVTINTVINKLTAPIQSIVGTAILGRGVVSSFAQPLNQGFGSGNSNVSVGP